MEEQTKKTARDRITNLGSITMITPINSNRKDLENSIKNDKDVLDRIKQMSLESLKFNPPRVLGGENRGDVHPLVEKYNPTSKPKIINKEQMRLHRLKFYQSKSE